MRPRRAQQIEDGELVALRGLHDLTRRPSASPFEIYEARDDADRAVLVKVAPRQPDRSTRALFDRERSRMARLKHVPTILQVESSDVLDDGRPYVVSELCATSLQERVDTAPPLPEAEVLEIARAVAEALERAHEINIVHGSVTPSNVLFRRSGDVVVADFGVALRQAFDPESTRAVAFTAPETLRDGILSSESDTYGLGAVLYTALVGKSPFPARPREHPKEQILRVMSETAPAVASELAGPEFSALLAELLSPEPDDRPDLLEVVERLESISATRPAAAWIPDDATVDAHAWSDAPADSRWPDSEWSDSEWSDDGFSADDRAADVDTHAQDDAQAHDDHRPEPDVAAMSEPEPAIPKPESFEPETIEPEPGTPEPELSGAPEPGTTDPEEFESPAAETPASTADRDPVAADSFAGRWGNDAWWGATNLHQAGSDDQVDKTDADDHEKVDDWSRTTETTAHHDALGSGTGVSEAEPAFDDRWGHDDSEPDTGSGTASTAGDDDAADDDNEIADEASDPDDADHADDPQGDAQEFVDDQADDHVDDDQDVDQDLDHGYRVPVVADDARAAHRAADTGPRFVDAGTGTAERDTDWTGLLEELANPRDRARGPEATSVSTRLIHRSKPQGPRTANRLAAVGGVVVGLIVLMLVADLSLRAGGHEKKAAASAAPSTTAAPTAAVAAPAVRLTDVRDEGTYVDVSWSGPSNLSYAVVVARPGTRAKVIFPGRKQSVRVMVEREAPYCFLVQATDGSHNIETDPRPIRNATCQA